LQLFADFLPYFILFLLFFFIFLLAFIATSWGIAEF